MQQPFRIWRTNWMVMTAGIVHGLWGITLLFSSAPLHTTPLGHFPIHNQIIAGSIYFMASALAFFPHIHFFWKHCRKYVWPTGPEHLDNHIFGLFLTLPQQFLLMLSFFTAVVAIVYGKYPDGYVPDKYGHPGFFIFCDQLWPMLGMICHTASLCDWYFRSRK